MNKERSGAFMDAVIATMVMLYLVHKSLKKDDPRPQVVEYMDHICKLVMISVVIMVIGAILGLMFWSPLLTIALIAAAIFITVRESQEKKREGLPDE